MIGDLMSLSEHKFYSTRGMIIVAESNAPSGFENCVGNGGRGDVLERTTVIRRLDGLAGWLCHLQSPR